ncbi:MAG: serine/threonine protein kinase [Candidatus Melainabacteria bacterium]|nr:serine/threonine protein kinase [Candidatus Melainabacteria bacterium]
MKEELEKARLAQSNEKNPEDSGTDIQALKLKIGEDEASLNPAKHKAGAASETASSGSSAFLSSQPDASQPDKTDADGDGLVLKLPEGAAAGAPVLPPAAAREAGARRHFDPRRELGDLVQQGYEFFDRIGKGSLGYVYQAKSKNIEDFLAVKIFHRKLFENKRTLKRLEQEARRAQQLSHPHLAAVYSFGVSEKGYPYLVMDFLSGPSLAEIIKEEGFLDVPRVIDIFLQVAEALQYAHDENMLHRDLKPSNIYLMKAEDGRDFVKVSDLGIAKVLPNPGRETKYMTPEGEEFGNPSYMSPEQCMGEKLGPASDLYSLGCVMYEALSGKLPVSSSNPVRLAFKQVSEIPKPLTTRFQDLDIPENLNAVVMNLLDKNPGSRLASAKELKEALLAVKAGKVPKLTKARGIDKEPGKQSSGSKPQNQANGNSAGKKGWLEEIIARVKGKK